MERSQKVYSPIHFYKKLPEWLYPVIGLIVCLLILLPFFSKNIIYSHDDFAFHRLRLEGYTEAVRHGNLFPKIFPDMAMGYGYAADLFYPSILLLPYALLRLAGLSYIHSYYGYQLLITAATFLCAYFSFAKITKNKKAAYFASLLYTTATYRLLDQFLRGALGETLAFIFLPLVLLGVYQLFFQEERRWKLLGVSMTLLLYSHFITAYLVVLSLGVFVIAAFFKHLLTKKSLLGFLKAILLSVALSLYVLAPIVEQTAKIDFNYLENKQLWSIGLNYSLRDLLANSLANSAENWSNIQPGIGIFLLLFVMVGFFFYKTFSKKNKVMFVVGIIYLILSTNLFPWVFFRKSNLAFIQFPWRILSLATLFLSLSCGLFLANYKRIQGIGLLTGTLLLLTFSYVGNIFYHFEADNVYPITNKEYPDFALDAIGGGKEYLPSDSDYEQLKTRGADYLLHSAMVTVLSSSKNRQFIQYAITSKNANELVVFPKIAYQGYTVTIDHQKIKPLIHQGLLAAKFSKGTHQVTIEYSGTFIQMTSLFLSGFTWISLFFSWLYFRFSMFLPKYKRKE